ncbi:MAG: alcohol dehydrogenase catalytic domain-containing protein [Thermoproteota archaeon]|nr:alcohol dehydrogenase catalytic domain-containing protein [Thermoproteota archaeon]
MKALLYHSPKDVQIDDKPPSNILNPEDVESRVTSTVICGSDLHLYHDTVPGMQPGQTLGHEFMGIVVVEEEETGPEIHEVEKWGNSFNGK